jgi:hypothetical protein
LSRLAQARRFADDAAMRLFPDRKLLLALLLPLAALACSGGSSGGSGGNAGTGGTAGSGGDTTSSAGGTGGTTGTAGTGGGTGGSGGTPVECKGPGYGGNEQAVNIGTVSATVLDQNGDPVAQSPVQVCGTNLCLYGTTNDMGKVTVLVNKTLKAPAFKYGDGVVYAKLAVALPAGDSTFGNVVTAKLPAANQGEKLVPGASATSAGVNLEIAANATIAFDLLTYPDAADQLFRVAEVPLGADVPAVDPALNIEAVFGLAPLETEICPAAKVTVPNTPMWAAGADVEFLILGLESTFQLWAPYGVWQKVAEGKVSADGTTIVSNDGQGLPILSTFGVRLKQ